ncbi:hypothetical protein [Nitratireductor sp. XY-223]|uniref:hypothetical protein n=1 Tax=Nitratireductor sp. XY-223 TaxID=2561926 RepID=UPI0010AA44A7|nr:hypothetical protein [Nitratireductor sp. XY-223]
MLGRLFPFIAALCALVAFLAVLAMIRWPPPTLQEYRYLLPVLIGLVAFPILILSIVFCAWVMSKLSIANSTHAFGLPQGSIRAVLAIAFIVLVLIFGVFVLTEAGETGRMLVATQKVVGPFPGQAILTTVSQELERLKEAFGPEHIYETTIDGTGDKAVATVSVYTVVDNSAVVQLAQQILTMLATALTAIVGFYFGSRSAGAAQDTADQNRIVNEAAEKKLAIQEAITHTATLQKTLLDKLMELRDEAEEADTREEADKREKAVDALMDHVEAEAGKVADQSTALMLSHEEIDNIRTAHASAQAGLKRLAAVENAVKSVVESDHSDWNAITGFEIPK